MDYHSRDFKKKFIGILQASNCFTIKMFKENGENVPILLQHVDNSDSEDSDDSNEPRYNSLACMNQRNHIRNKINIENLGNFKKYQSRPTIGGCYIEVLFENLHIIVFDKNRIN
jgi:hypothetical protein